MFTHRKDAIFIVTRVRKICIYPNKKQTNHINGILGCCNWIKNKYLEVNIRRYENGKSFISAYTFSKFINYLKKHYDDFKWINKYSSKAIQDAMLIEEKAYKRFFKKVKDFLDLNLGNILIKNHISLLKIVFIILKRTSLNYQYLVK